MNELFRLAGNLISGAIGLAVVGYGIKYGFDAAKGEYCFPLDSRTTVVRHAAALGNDVVNFGATMLEKKTCPTLPIFRTPAKAKGELTH